MMHGTGDRYRFDEAKRRLMERRTALAAPTDWGLLSRGDDPVGAYAEEIGLFTKDRKLMHGVSWVKKRSGLRQRVHRWLEFDQVGTVWVYLWTSGHPVIKFFGLAVKIFDDGTDPNAEDVQDKYWVQFGEFRLFGPFYNEHYAVELAGLVGAELGVRSDVQPREHPAPGNVVRAGERIPSGEGPSVAQKVIEEPVPRKERTEKPRPPREREQPPTSQRSRLPAPPKYGE